jgi:hypothetical protein
MIFNVKIITLRRAAQHSGTCEASHKIEEGAKICFEKLRKMIGRAVGIGGGIH